jgi:hypothetical protein
MSNKLVKRLFFVSVVLLVSACISIPKPQPDLTNPIRTVVILPFSNMSNNVDAPNSIRKVMSTQLKAKFYKVESLDEVDRILADKLGITLGEQLAEVDFKDIKAAIPADGYIFGHITHYDQTTMGILNTNRVRTEMKLVQASSDNEFWSSAIGIKSESKAGGLAGSFASLASSVSDANDDTQWITIERKTGGDGSFMGNLISGLVEKAVASATNTTLTEETLAMVRHSTQTLRNGPGF